jgi:LDH2 family malate/lactate/ureidoglycolate dehydrogenase
VADIRHKCCNPKADPVILKEGPSTAWVDGNNGLGVVVGTFRCVDVILKNSYSLNYFLMA